MKRGTLIGLSFALMWATWLAVFEPPFHAIGASAAFQREWSDVTGTVIGIGGRSAGRSRSFRLSINSYTSAAEVEQLNSALQSGGDDELLKSLSRMKAGRIVIGNNIGVTANAVIASPTDDGGTKLTLLFERNINFYELRYGARSTDYRFGHAEIYLDRRGRGEGTFIGAARIRSRGANTWEVEDFGTFPARIMGVRATGRVPAR